MRLLYREFFDKSFISSIEAECVRLKKQITKIFGNWGFSSVKKDTDLINYFESRKGKWNRFVQIGMGGSVLGAQALCEFLDTPKGKSIEFVDDIDSSYISSLTYSPNTCYHIVSKSGSTVETIANFIYLINHFKGDPGKQIIVSTGSSGFLKDYADNHNIKRFLIPDNVGGRYSVFTPVGMAAASFLEYDIDKIFVGMNRALENLISDTHASPYLLAAIASEFLRKNRRNLVLFCYSEKLLKTVYWFRQLWAESLGKLIDKDGNPIRTGQTPIVAQGTSDQHSQIQLYREGPLDKLFCFFRGPANRDERLNAGPDFDRFNYLSGYSLNEIKYAEYRATKHSLAEHSPVISIETDSYSEQSLGLLIMNLMLATAITGELLNIDAFNQPGVELGKRLTKTILTKNEI
ncbi:MAG: hypothetical protein GXP60_07090 [Epsilonproteobacteria bacterium]|nr:hypothetical protein [Campylobacterota bacterium]